MNFQIKDNELAALKALALAPATRKTIEDAHAREVVERTRANERIRALDSQAEKDWPASQAAKAKAIERREAAIRALRDADAALAKANAESFNQSAEYTRLRHAEEAALIERADLVLIGKWKDELLSELTALGRPSVIFTSTTTTRSEATGKPIKSGVSNMASIVARMKAVRQSYENADELLLLPDQRTLPAVIARERSSWPLVDQNPQPKVTQS